MTICDSHVHVVGDLADAPQVAGRTHTAGPASLSQLERLGAPVGVTRFVVVQPSFYGIDNSVTLGALAALNGRGRGVAVIDPATVAQAELDAMHTAGIRGLRLNVYSTLAVSEHLAARFAATAAVAQRMHWHVEVIALMPALAAAADLLAASPVPVVLDHYGLYSGVELASTTATALLQLLRQRHVWMKLSAPYRSSDDALATRPDPAWLAALLDAGADRCVWGSDWPHTPPHNLQTGGGVSLPYRELDYATVLGSFTACMPPTLADRVLRNNPARLYEFQ